MKGPVWFLKFSSVSGCSFSRFSDDLIYFLLTGSGFVSNDLYLHGLFSASIKLPSDYSAGVVVAFYVSEIFSLSLKLLCMVRTNQLNIFF